MPYGYTGKILRVNLTTGQIGVDEHEENWYRTYMGGALYGAWYLLHETEPGIDPYGPDNMMIFATSPIVGAPAAGFNRMVVMARSPITGGFGEAQTGGFTAAELKFAGFDAVVVTGKAAKPVYLWIHNGECEIRDASHVWGMLTADAEEAICKEHGDKRDQVPGYRPQRRADGPLRLRDRQPPRGRRSHGYGRGHGLQESEVPGHPGQGSHQHEGSRSSSRKRPSGSPRTSWTTRTTTTWPRLALRFTSAARASAACSRPKTSARACSNRSRASRARR